MEEDQVDIQRIIYLKSPSLIVGWNTSDIGRVSFRVLQFLKEKLDAQEIAEIKPLGFFPFGGVMVKRDIVQIYESKFWVCEKDNILIFQSNEPAFEHYRFLNILLDFAERYYQVKEIYTVNGTVSFIAHTQSRRLFTVFNDPALKGRLQGYGIEHMTWEGPPAISSYLLWLAGRRGISGVSLWPEVPFYLAAREDPEAIKAVLSFFNRKLGLYLDLTVLDMEIEEQLEKLSRLRKTDPEIDRTISRVEKGQKIDEEGEMKLTKRVYEFL